jgi:hypothetical protein
VEVVCCLADQLWEGGVSSSLLEGVLLLLLLAKKVHTVTGSSSKRTIVCWSSFEFSCMR